MYSFLHVLNIPLISDLIHCMVALLKASKVKSLQSCGKPSLHVAELCINYGVTWEYIYTDAVTSARTFPKKTACWPDLSNIRPYDARATPQKYSRSLNRERKTAMIGCPGLCTCTIQYMYIDSTTYMYVRTYMNCTVKLSREPNSQLSRSLSQPIHNLESHLPSSLKTCCDIWVRTVNRPWTHHMEFLPARKALTMRNPSLSLMKSRNAYVSKQLHRIWCGTIAKWILLCMVVHTQRVPPHLIWRSTTYRERPIQKPWPNPPDASAVTSSEFRIEDKAEYLSCWTNYSDPKEILLQINTLNRHPEYHISNDSGTWRSLMVDESSAIDIRTPLREILMYSPAFFLLRPTQPDLAVLSVTCEWSPPYVPSTYSTLARLMYRSKSGQSYPYIDMSMTSIWTKAVAAILLIVDN